MIYHASSELLQTPPTIDAPMHEEPITRISTHPFRYHVVYFATKQSVIYTHANARYNSRLFIQDLFENEP